MGFSTWRVYERGPDDFNQMNTHIRQKRPLLISLFQNYKEKIFGSKNLMSCHRNDSSEKFLNLTTVTEQKRFS